MTLLCIVFHSNMLVQLIFQTCRPNHLSPIILCKIILMTMQLNLRLILIESNLNTGEHSTRLLLFFPKKMEQGKSLLPLFNDVVLIEEAIVPTVQ